MTAVLLVTLRAPPTPVDLAAVGVGAAVGGQDRAVADARLRRQVLRVEEESLAGAAAHEDGRYAFLHGVSPGCQTLRDRRNRKIN